MDVMIYRPTSHPVSNGCSSLFRSMTEEMYMEAFPNRDQVKPRDRDEYEGELETVNHELKIFEKKREERAKYK